MGTQRSFPSSTPPEQKSMKRRFPRREFTVHVR
jgi:hypothetical protein